MGVVEGLRRELADRIEGAETVSVQVFEVVLDVSETGIDLSAVTGDAS